MTLLFCDGDCSGIVEAGKFTLLVAMFSKGSHIQDAARKPDVDKTAASFELSAFPAGPCK
jgi:hypothetical protein